MKKIICNLVLVILITTQCLTSNALPSTSLKDIKGHWATASMIKWFDNGVIHGNENGQFYPDVQITRAELFTLLNSVLGYTDTNAPAFEDISSKAWCYNELLKARSAGYLVCDDNKALPNEYVSRQEAFNIIVLAFGLKSKKDIDLEFSDKKLIEPSLYDSTKILVELGAVSGFSDHTIRPNNKISRAEMLIVLDKIVGTYISKPGTYTISNDNNGVVIINSKDVIIKDSEVSDSLYISQAVGEGEVTLENSTVTGEIYVKGGGINSIKLKNCKISSIIVNKKTGKVRIVAEGNTNIDAATVNSNTKLENNSTIGFKDVTIDTNLYEGYEVELVGSFDTVIIDSPVKVNLSGETTVKNITVAPNSKPTIETSDSSVITNLQIDSSAQITGKGKITNSVINADGVSIEAEVKNVQVSDNVGTLPVVNGKEYSKPPVPPTTPPTTPPSTSTSNNNSGSTSGNTNNNNNGNTSGNTNNTQKYIVSENEYIKLYSSLPVENGKVDPTSELSIKTKDGYSLDFGYLDIKNTDINERIYSSFISKHSGPLEKSHTLTPINSSNSLEYGVSYQIEFYSFVVVDSTNKPIVTTSLSISTKEYTGESQPILLDAFKNIKLVNMTGIVIPMYSHIYHPYNLDMIYSISVSDTNVLSANYNKDNGCLSMYALKPSNTPITVSITAMDENSKKLIASFTVEVINPVNMEYKKVDDGIDYIEVSYNSGFGVNQSDLNYLNKVMINDDTQTMIIEDVTSTENIVTGYKIYLSNSDNEKIDFDPAKKYIFSLYCGYLCDTSGNNIGCGTYTAQLLIETKAIILENDYFILYANKPFKEGKVAVDSRLIVEFKDGYGIYKDQYYKYFSFENQFTSWVETRPSQPGIAQKITFEKYYELIDSNNLKYNTEYSFSSDLSKIIDLSGASLGLTGINTQKIGTEPYTEEDKPLIIDNTTDLGNINVILGTEVAINLNNFIYSPSNKNITFSSTSNNIVLSEITDESILRVKAKEIGVSQITITAEDDLKTTECTLGINVVESPVNFEYIKNADLDYFEITMKNGYSLSLVDLGQDVLNINNNSNSHELVKISDSVYQLFVVDSENNRVDCIKGEKYTFFIRKYAITNSNGATFDIFNYFIYYSFTVVNTPVEKSKSFDSIDNVETITLDLAEYFTDIDGDAISYEITPDILGLIEITEDNGKFSFTASSSAEAGNEINLSIKATDNEQATPTEESLKITVSVVDGTKVLTLAPN